MSMDCGYKLRHQRRCKCLLLVPALLTALVAAAGAQVSPPRTATASPPSGQFDTAGEAQLVILINQARSEQGVAPLMVDDRLTRAAEKHTLLMTERGDLSHQLEGEPAVQRRISDEGVPWDAEGENVAFNQTVAGAHQSLMNSPLHRDNILNPAYNAVGVGIVRHGQNIYVTEDFAQRLPEYSEPQAEAAVQHAMEAYTRSIRVVAPARRPESRLRHLACNMALNDKVDQSAAQLPGVQEVFAWTAGDPGVLPDRVEKRLSQPMAAGYALGACFAPSVSHPGGVYWIVMVMY
jgi:uncharacterized protein YkwD